MFSQEGRFTFLNGKRAAEQKLGDINSPNWTKRKIFGNF